MQIARTPVVISREATSGSAIGESIRSTNSDKTENRITNPPTCVRTVKLSMMELLTEPMKGTLRFETGSEVIRTVWLCTKVTERGWCGRMEEKKRQMTVESTAASREERGINRRKYPIKSGRCSCTSATYPIRNMVLLLLQTVRRN